jgi:Mg-chelatase subunit ChlD
MSSPTATHVCMVLDRSGSMQAAHADALGSVNTYIETAKKDEALQNSWLSLVTFNSHSVQVIRKDLHMSEVKPVLAEEYRCDGWTPLFDAIGRGIGVLDEALGNTPQGRAILVVMTDGMENASKEFSHDRIKALIDARKERGWLVTFLGEGLDVAQQGVNVGVAQAAVASYVGAAGLRAAGRVLASSHARFFATIGDMAQAQDAAALTPEERDALAGKKD